jgi:hypothetical protein
MKKNIARLCRASLLLVLALTACNSATPAPTDAPTSVPPTDTPQPTATFTPLPTDTPEPTFTPDVAATEKAEAFQALLEKFWELGYISSIEGESLPVKDFEGEFNQLANYFKWWWLDEMKGEYSAFVFSAHLEWGSYSSTPDVSGCGLGFGIKENGDHYALFLSREHLVLARGKGSRISLMGTAGGEKYPTIPIPAKAEFVVAVAPDKIAASVNGKITFFNLSSDQDALGKLAFSVLGGTNSGYGTRCNMTNIVFWMPK